MRLFFICWPDFNPAGEALALSLKAAGHEIVYWVAVIQNEPFSQAAFPGTIFHDHQDAVLQKSAPAFFDKRFAPPDPALLKKLYECESEILMMMSKRFDWMGVYERKRFYYGLVQYWHGVMTECRPDQIIFPAAPHTVYDFVIYHLAKLSGIRTFMFDSTWVGDRLLPMNDYVYGSTRLSEEVEKNKEKLVSVDDLPLDIRDYYLKQINPFFDSTPPSINNFLNKYAWRKIFHMRLKFIRESWQKKELLPIIAQSIVKRFTPTIKDEFLSVQSAADLSKPFVYVPLHYQPEGTTSPLGGIFVDQLLMVQTLSAALPVGWELYIKENPQQWQPRGLNYFTYRYKGFYQAIAAIPKVRLVPLSTNTFDLIHASKAVATVTGTAGWEAVLRNKPTLLFGYAWYRHCYGVVQVHNFEYAKIALDKIEAGFLPTTENMLRYLYSFGTVSFHGILEEYAKKFSTLTPEENNRQFLSIVENELKKV